MRTTRRSLSLDIAQYRRLADDSGFFTSQQICELLLRGYAAGALAADVPEHRRHQPGVRGRCLLALSDEAFAGAETAVGAGRVSLLLDTLIGAYLAGEATVTAHATTSVDNPQRAGVTAVPPARADDPTAG